MENIPKAIYLNIGNDITDIQDFNALDDVTWCADKIGKHDIKYILAKGSKREQFEIVMAVMSLLRQGKISSMTPNCDVMDLVIKKLKEESNENKNHKGLTF